MSYGNGCSLKGQSSNIVQKDNLFVIYLVFRYIKKNQPNALRKFQQNVLLIFFDFNRKQSIGSRTMEDLNNVSRNIEL